MPRTKSDTPNSDSRPFNVSLPTPLADWYEDQAEEGFRSTQQQLRMALSRYAKDNGYSEPSAASDTGPASTPPPAAKPAASNPTSGKTA
jgi:hypothetical protein